MKIEEISELIVLIDNLENRITEILDENCETLDGPLRIKMSIAESNLHKVSSLLKQKIKDVCS